MGFSGSLNVENQISYLVSMSYDKNAKL